MLFASIVTKIEVDGIVDSDLSFHKKSEVFLIYHLGSYIYYLHGISERGETSFEVF